MIPFYIKAIKLNAELNAVNESVLRVEININKINVLNKSLIIIIQFGLRYCMLFASF